MPGRKPQFTRPPRQAHPLGNRQAPKKPVVAVAPATEAPVAETKLTKPAKDLTPALDGAGQPFITLAQLLKKHTLVGTGGEAKHLVRAGGITVNGAEESRPGRKLHTGDIVQVAGKPIAVVVDA